MSRNIWTPAKQEQDLKRQCRETLLELANLSDTDTRRFMVRMVARYYDGRSFRSGPLVYRDDLRKIWSGDREATDRSLRLWLEQARKSPPWHLVSMTDYGRPSWGVYPNYYIFPLALALGVSEMKPQMAVCGNPECPNRYFLKARKTQRFCDRPACAAYGQREHKRKWWSEHGEKWKQEREKVRKSSSKRHRKGGR
jgi:hypothetical protein